MVLSVRFGMKNPGLFQVVHQLVQHNAGLGEGERVCVVTDTNKLDLAEIFVDVAAAQGVDPVMLVMKPRAQHGQEVPETIASAMAKADLVFQIVTHAMTHTDATQHALQSGARVMVLRGVTEDLMLNGAINADYQSIGKRCAQLIDLMTKARRVFVSTPQGTDLVMDLTDRTPKALDGMLKGPGTFAAIPDGETAISPAEGTTEGMLVVENTMDGLGLLDQPIHMKVVAGRVVSIEGGSSARQLQGIVDAGDEGAANIAEFAIGTNPKARLVGNMAEDKKLEGSVHIAIGDNHVLGGTVISDIHFDGLLLKPTVEMDGQIVLEQGRFVV